MEILKEELADSSSLIRFIYKKRRVFLAGIILGAIAGFIYFKILPQKYESIGVIYPSRYDSRDRLLENPQFGYKTEHEQLLQLLISTSIQDSVVKKFNLIDHYDIDTLKRDWKNDLQNAYNLDVEITRSKYLAIEINATTIIPELSANIVNYIMVAVNNYREQIFKENRHNEMNYLRNKMNDQLQKVKQIKAKIYTIKDSTKKEENIELIWLKNMF